MRTVDLIPERDVRASFYGKARMVFEEDRTVLVSYNTEVAYVKDNEAIVNGVYSATTTRHIKEFLYQNGFKIYDSGKELYEQYKFKLKKFKVNVEDIPEEVEAKDYKEARELVMEDIFLVEVEEWEEKRTQKEIVRLH